MQDKGAFAGIGSRGETAACGCGSLSVGILLKSRTGQFPGRSAVRITALMVALYTGATIHRALPTARRWAIPRPLYGVKTRCYAPKSIAEAFITPKGASPCISASM